MSQRWTEGSAFTARVGEDGKLAIEVSNESGRFALAATA